VWSLVGVTHTESIDVDYGREEKVIRYGSKYIAAAMELYEASKEQMTIQYIETFPAYTYGGDGAPKSGAVFCVSATKPPMRGS